MEQLAEEIDVLKRNLSAKDSDLRLAATFGQNLLEETNELKRKLEKITSDNGSKTEAYEQEKYSLTMQLQSRENLIQSLHEELENQERNQSKEIQKVTLNFEDQLSILNKKISALNSTIEVLENELAINNEEASESRKIYEELKQKREESFIACNDATLEDSQVVQSELFLLISQKEDLVTENLGLKTTVKKLHVEIDKLMKSLQYFEKEIDEKECQLTAMYNTIEKSKEKNLEIQMEIDNLKMDATDPNKKGNSLFAEVEDNRRFLEKLVLSLKANYATLKEQYELKAQHNSKLKLQIASLIDVGTTKADLDYQKFMEDSLAITKGQLDEFSKRCKELEADLKEAKCNNEMTSKKEHKLEVCNEGIESFFKGLYEENLKKIEATQEEVTSVRFANVSLNDKIIQLQRKLHRLEQEKNSAICELIKLKVQVEEMTIDRGELIVDKNKVTVKVKEKLTNIKPKVTELTKLQLNEVVEKTKCTLKEKSVTQINDLGLEKKLIIENINESAETNKENEKVFPPKVKKSLQISSTVSVQDSDGQINDIDLKLDAPGIKPKAIRRKMVPMKVIMASESKDTQCAQQ